MKKEKKKKKSKKNTKNTSTIDNKKTSTNKNMTKENYKKLITNFEIESTKAAVKTLKNFIHYLKVNEEFEKYKKKI